MGDRSATARATGPLVGVLLDFVEGKIISRTAPQQLHRGRIEARISFGRRRCRNRCQQSGGPAERTTSCTVIKTLPSHRCEQGRNRRGRSVRRDGGTNARMVGCRIA
jgi:hypothetical protein